MAACPSENELLAAKHRKSDLYHGSVNAPDSLRGMRLAHCATSNNHQLGLLELCGRVAGGDWQNHLAGKRHGAAKAHEGVPAGPP